MNTLQNVDINLSELVEDIEKGNYLIPRFQRPFVWKTTDVENLGDSIIRGYPISSMLMMPANGSLKVHADALKTSGATSNGNNQTYVLDGQQRLTSIAKLFLGLDESKEYYFDMLSILHDAFPDDNIPLIPSIKDRISKGRSDRSYGFSAITQELCRHFTKNSGNPTETRQANRFIRGREIIEKRYAMTINKFLRIIESEITEANLEKYTNHLSGIFGNVSSGYSVPVTKINADADLGLVVRVFEKVNSTGKKLTLFDLINAKSFETSIADYQSGLGDYLSLQLTTLDSSSWNVRAIDDFFEASKSSDGVKSYSNLARFVRINAISHLLKKGVMPSITNADMLSKDSDFWFNGWIDCRETLLKFIEWLYLEKINDLANSTFVEYIAAVLIEEPKLLNQPVFMKEIKKYILRLSITGIGFSKTNLDVVMSFKSFGRDVLKSHEFEKHKYNLNDLYFEEFNPDQLLKFTQGKKQFDSILHILYSENVGGKFNIDLLGNNVKSSVSFDEHHIIPKSRFKSDNCIFLSVANFVLLNSISNRQEVKDKMPCEYLGKIKETTGTSYNYILDQNEIIGFDSICDEESAIPFLQKRLEIITHFVNEYFKGNR